tara:strand:+ start:1429 stop:1632 length:204 start_codon:yes stop_codon:yes gene_type:complete
MGKMSELSRKTEQDNIAYINSLFEDDKELLSTCCGAAGLGNIHEFDGEHYGLCAKCKDHCDFEYEDI